MHKTIAINKTDLIKNNNLKEEQLGMKKLHLKKRDNTVLTNSNLKYLSSIFWQTQKDYTFELQKPNDENASFTSLNDIRIKKKFLTS